MCGVVCVSYYVCVCVCVCVCVVSCVGYVSVKMCVLRVYRMWNVVCVIHVCVRVCCVLEVCV